MILSQPDLRDAVTKRKIEFNPPLEENQWGEASVDLRLGFSFTPLKSLPGMKVSVAQGLAALGAAGFWKTIELAEFNNLGQRETFSLEPESFVLAMTYESVTVPRDMIARIEGRSTYARVGLSMHQTAPWIQPGWSGPIVLEMMNNGPLTIELTPLIDRPCQLTFFKLSKPLPRSLGYGARPTDVYKDQTHPLVHPSMSLYSFEDSKTCDCIRINDSWRAFLTENLGIVQSFAEYYLTLYLQARNPNVPGVVNKLRAPTMRQLTAAREFWLFVRSDFEKTGKAVQFKDIYSERQLADSFSIDHFLPWSFVVHNLLWNLTPVEPATNSSKNDLLPDLDLYLPRLAKLHFSAIEAAKKRPKFLEDYTDCFKQDITSLLAQGENVLVTKYREVIVPQAQIAMNQGFQFGWKLRN